MNSPPSDSPLITHHSPYNSNINHNHSSNQFSSTLVHNSPCETMRRRPRTTLLLSLCAILLFAAFSLHLSRHAVSDWRPDHDLDDRPKHNFKSSQNYYHVHNNANIVNHFSRQTRHVSSVIFKHSFSTVSVLLPDWEILLLVTPNTPLSSFDQFNCLFRNNDVTPARFSGVLPFSNRSTFKCDMPETVRRRRMFSQPMLVSGTSENESRDQSPAPELWRWNFLVYESFSMEDDVVLFAKGVNHRQGYDRSPTEVNCVFQIGDGIRTAVTSSVQEIFRCPHPDPSQLGPNYRIGVSLEIIAENIVVPSVAYYTPNPSHRPNTRPDTRPVENSLTMQKFEPKYFLCACTMVYNVAKFLREWVMYHSKIGVENFLLYDNGSDDDLEGIVKELISEGYNISTLFWIWPKTQEAGFSHSILYSKSKGLCTWMMYVDVDEFMYSPSWGDSNGTEVGSRLNSIASNHHGLRHRHEHVGGGKNNELPSLKTFLPREHGKNYKGKRIGQVSMMCLEFGPSGQRQHPIEGVTQGYTCRRRVEQRHKSIVLVEAVDRSLWNVIHHFQVNEKEGYRSKQLGAEEGLVNHYKYQAWDEFKMKFRRRVSAYVVDWRQAVNPNSKDRTPGLGFEAVEPKDWTQRFCEVRDQRLKMLTREWFGSSTHNGYRMAWQSS